MLDKILLSFLDWFLLFPQKNYRTKKGFLLISLLIILLFKATTNFIKNFYNISFIYTICISIILILIWYIIWSETRILVKINKSDKPGIAFFVDSSILTKKDLEKEKFISILETKLQPNYNILFYDKYEYDIIQKRFLNDEEIMKKLNIIVKFIIDEENGNCNGKNNYIFKLNEAVFIMPENTSSILSNPIIHNNLQKEMNFLFDRSFCISNDNNLSDSKVATNSITYSVSYIYASILCIKADLEKSLIELNNIEVLIDKNDMIKDVRKQLKLNILIKYIFCYQKDIIKIIDSKNYYEYTNQIPKMTKENEEVFILANRGLKEFPTNRIFFEKIIDNYKMTKAILFFDSDKKIDALDQIHKLNWEKIDNIEIALLNKAFLLIMNQEYDKGLYFYSKALKMIKRNYKSFDETYNIISNFINVRLENNSDINLFLCHLITEYLFYNTSDSKIKLNIFLNENDNIKTNFNKYFELN